MKVLFTLFVSVGLALLSFSAQAERVTVHFTATIDYMHETRDVLSRNMNIGDAITGSYTVDLGMPDDNVTPDYGEFTLPSPLPPGLGFTLDLPNLTYTPNSEFADLRVYTFNGPYSDYFTVSSCCGDIGSLPEGMAVTSITLDFYDPTGGTLTEVNLNTDPDILKSFPDKRFMLSGYDAQTGNQFNIEATIIDVAYPEARCDAPAPFEDENTVSVTATVIDVHEANPGGSGIYIGNSLSGKFTIDPNKPDQDPQSEYARYEYPLGDASGNVKITIAGDTVVGNPEQHHYSIYIRDVMPGYSTDEFVLSSNNEQMPLSNGTVIENVDLVFHDPYGNALNQASLPESIPTDVGPWLENDIYLSGHDSNGGYFYVRAKIDSVRHNLPMPVSPLTISPSDGQFIERQLFHTAIYLEPDLPPIIDQRVSMLVNGSEVPLPDCNLAGTTLDNRQIIFCGIYPNRALRPGTNVLKVYVELLDHTFYTNQVNWELLAIP